MQSSTYRVILKECSIAGNGRAAYAVLQDMTKDKMEIVASDIEMAVTAICKNNRFDSGIWKLGYDLIKNYSTASRLLKVETYNSILSCMGNEGYWSDVRAVLSMMENQPNQALIHPRPNLSTYHYVLESLFHSVEGPQWAFQLLASMKSNDISPSLYTFDLALTIFLKRENNSWKMALDLIDFMHQNAHTPSLVMYNRVISSCAQSQQLGHATSLLMKMKNRNVKPDIVTYNSIISACASLGRWRDALGYLQETIQDPSIEPDIITYTNAIRACSKGRKSEKALELFQDAKKRNLPLDTYIYTSVIDACAKGNIWKKSLELLDDMRSSGIPPNRFTYSAAISACANSGEWEEAISLLDQVTLVFCQNSLL
jgi:pentatricopeptide repeat protein